VSGLHGPTNRFQQINVNLPLTLLSGYWSWYWSRFNEHQLDTLCFIKSPRLI